MRREASLPEGAPRPRARAAGRGAARRPRAPPRPRARRAGRGARRSWPRRRRCTAPAARGGAGVGMGEPAVAPMQTVRRRRGAARGPRAGPCPVGGPRYGRRAVAGQRPRPPPGAAAPGLARSRPPSRQAASLSARVAFRRPLYGPMCPWNLVGLYRARWRPAATGSNSVFDGTRVRAASTPRCAAHYGCRRRRCCEGPQMLRSPRPARRMPRELRATVRRTPTAAHTPAAAPRCTGAPRRRRRLNSCHGKRGPKSFRLVLDRHTHTPPAAPDRRAPPTSVPRDSSAASRRLQVRLRLHQGVRHPAGRRGRAVPARAGRGRAAGSPCARIGHAGEGGRRADPCGPPHGPPRPRARRRRAANARAPPRPAAAGPRAAPCAAHARARRHGEPARVDGRRRRRRARGARRH